MVTSQKSVDKFKSCNDKSILHNVNLKFTAFQNLLQKPKHFKIRVFEECPVFFKSYNYDIFFQSHILRGNDTKWMSSVK